MTPQQQSDCLDFFSRVALIAAQRFGDPLWTSYSDPITSVWDSLGIFLEGYAFERQGRAADFPAVAADVVAELRSLTPDPSQVWLRFSTKLGGGDLNIMNNPLAPQGTKYTNKTGGTFKTTKYSAIEVAIEVGAPLVQWVRHRLKEALTLTGILFRKKPQKNSCNSQFRSRF
jgi:hypothetical protein